MKKKLFTGLVIGMLMLATVWTANASTLSTVISMDNGYEIFISTSDSVAGTSFGAHNDWYTAYTDSTTLQDGIDYYLHVYGYDQGGPGGFLGIFTLTGTDHIFSNSAYSLSTNINDWKGNNIGFGSTYLASLIDVGVNDGLNIWSLIYDIPVPTHRIWAGDRDQNDFAYFSTKISSRSADHTIPEPTTMLLLGLGMIGLAGVRRKFSK